MADLDPSILNPPLTGGLAAVPATGQRSASSNPVADFAKMIPNRYGVLKAESKSVDELRKQQQAAREDLMKKKEAESAPFTENARSAEDAIRDMKTPAAPNQKEFKPEHMSDKDITDSYAIYSLMAFLGGGHGRNSMQTALAGFTGAVKGLKQGDMAQAEEQYKVFKENFEVAQKKYENEIKEYDQAISKHKFDIDAAMREVNLIALKYDNQGILSDKSFESKISSIDSIRQGYEKAREFDQKNSEIQQKIRESNKPTYGKDSQGNMVAITTDPKTGLSVMRPVKKEDGEVVNGITKFGAGSGKGDKATMAEERATSNYTTMFPADSRIDNLIKKGVKLPAYAYVEANDDGYISMYSKSGRQFTLDDDQQELMQSIKQFSEGAGHLKSGARINKQTMDIMRDLYAPMSNDSEHTLKIKSDARKNDLIAAEVLSGNGAGKVRPRIQVDSSQSAEEGIQHPKDIQDILGKYK